MSKVMGKTYFNDSWLINKEYSAWIIFIEVEITMTNLKYSSCLVSN